MTPLPLKVLTAFFFLISTSCMHMEEEAADTEVFTASRSKVWEALIQVFTPYKLEISDEERGLIKTKLILGSNVWTPAHDEDKDISGVNYYITAKLVYDKPHATVTITKKMKQKKGFLFDSKTIPSDLMEEQLLLYRLGRELRIKKLIKKYGR